MQSIVYSVIRKKTVTQGDFDALCSANLPIDFFIIFFLIGTYYSFHVY